MHENTYLCCQRAARVTSRSISLNELLNSYQADRIQPQIVSADMLADYSLAPPILRLQGVPYQLKSLVGDTGVRGVNDSPA